MLLLATLRVRRAGLHGLFGRRGSLLCRISNILACLLYSRGSLLSQITETTAGLFYLIGGLLSINLQVTTGLRARVRYLLDILTCVVWQIATHFLEALT